jgi:hypothetical protein
LYCRRKLLSRTFQVFFNYFFHLIYLRWLDPAGSGKTPNFSLFSAALQAEVFRHFELGCAAAHGL